MVCNGSCYPKAVEDNVSGYITCWVHVGKPAAVSTAAWRELEIQAWRLVPYGLGPDPSKTLEIKKI